MLIDCDTCVCRAPRRHGVVSVLLGTGDGQLVVKAPLAICPIRASFRRCDW